MAKAARPQQQPAGNRTADQVAQDQQQIPHVGESTEPIPPLENLDSLDPDDYPKPSGRPNDFSVFGPNGAMFFEGALSAMREGKRVYRAAWPIGVFSVIMPKLNLPPYNTQDATRKVNDRTAKWIGEGTPLNCFPYFAMYVPNGNIWQPGWVPNIYDLLGEDWSVMEDPA